MEEVVVGVCGCEGLVGVCRLLTQMMARKRGLRARQFWVNPEEDICPLWTFQLRRQRAMYKVIEMRV